MNGIDQINRILIELAEVITEDDSKVFGEVVIGGDSRPARKLRIAAITDSELSTINEVATPPDPSRGIGAPQLIVCLSLSRVSGKLVYPDLFKNKLIGDLETIAEAILNLSGLTEVGPGGRPWAGRSQGSPSSSAFSLSTNS